jgi:hypothetical protein
MGTLAVSSPLFLSKEDITIIKIYCIIIIRCVGVNKVREGY